MGENVAPQQHITIYKSKKVHVGDVIVINGPVTVKTSKRKKQSDQFFYNSVGVISRTSWLAQPANEKQILDKPAKYVIICK